MSDPYVDEDDFQPVSSRGKSATARIAALTPLQPDEGDDLNRVLALQPLNDFGNAKRLILRFGKQLMFVNNIGWYVWDGNRWDREGGQNGAVRFGYQVPQAI